MKKNFRLTIAALLLSGAAFAQNVKIEEQPIKKGKEVLSGYMVRYKYGSAISKETIESKIAEAGLKRSSHKKGYSVYRGVVWPAISPLKLDYYYKMSGKKKSSTLYFAASKGYDNYITTQSDSAAATGIKHFLTDLDGQILIHKQIADKEAELKKADKEAAKAGKEKDKADKERAKAAKERAQTQAELNTLNQSK